MFTVRSKLYSGWGVTKARAIAGLCHAHQSDDRIPRADIELTVIEFRNEDYYGQDTDWHNPENWAEEITHVTITPDEFHEFADRHVQMERQGSIAEGEADWRIDYGDEDITYVIKSEDTGTVVGMQDHWDRAKEALEEVNNWDDGETYWIKEVEGDVKLQLAPVDGSAE